MKYKFIYYLFIFSFIITWLLGCDTVSSNDDPRTYTHFCFDTVCQITIYSSYSDQETEMIQTCFELCDQYDKQFNKHNKESEISKINGNSSDYIKVSPETFEIIKNSKYYSNLSKGTFDITISPIVDLWDINNNPHIPKKSEISQALALINYNDILLKDSKVRLSHKEQKIDLGGIAKGYVADKIKKHLENNQITSAIINLGGNILTIGNNNDDDFMIGIKKPFGENDNDYSAKLKITDMSVVTSGTYERYFIENDKLYHHIFDPYTGYPVDNNLYSVTIISEKSETGDALSTATFVMGLKEGLSFINKLDNIYAVFITDDYKIHLSDGLIINDENEISISH